MGWPALIGSDIVFIFVFHHEACTMDRCVAVPELAVVTGKISGQNKPQVITWYACVIHSIDVDVHHTQSANCPAPCHVMHPYTFTVIFV